MIFDDDNELMGNEEILYEGKPSFLFTCKNVIIGFVVVAFILGSTLTILSTISDLEVYSFDSLRYPIAQYVSLAIYGFIFLIIIWSIWNLVNWYSINYIVTNGRVITKSGIIREQKSYISFKNVQDINVSRSVLNKLFGVGTVVVSSAYDKGDVVLKNIRSPQKVEEIIFQGMYSSSNFNNMNFPNNNYYPGNNHHYNPYQNPNNPDYQQPYSNQPYPQQYGRNIKQNYYNNHYNPEEEYNKCFDDPLLGLSNEPLSNNPKDNELYYNDYQVKEGYDENIHNPQGNFGYNSRVNNNYPPQNGNYDHRNIHSSQSNIVYQGHSFKDDYRQGNDSQNPQNYTSHEYNSNLRGNVDNRPHYPPHEGNFHNHNRDNNYHNHNLNHYEGNRDYQYNNQYSKHNNFNQEEYNKDQYVSEKEKDTHTKKSAEKKNRKSVLAKHARKFKK